MQNNIDTRVREWPTNISIGQSPSKFHLLYEHLNPVDTWDKPAGFWEAPARRARRGPHLLVRPLCIPLLLKWRSDIWIIAFYCHKVQIRTLVSPGERSHIVHCASGGQSIILRFLHHVACNVTALNVPPPRHPFTAAEKKKTATWLDCGAQSTRRICA